MSVWIGFAIAVVFAVLGSVGVLVCAVAHARRSQMGLVSTFHEKNHTPLILVPVAPSDDPTGRPTVGNALAQVRAAAEAGKVDEMFLQGLVCLAVAYVVAAFGGTVCLLWAPFLLVAAGTALVLMIVFVRSTFEGVREPDRLPKILRMLCGRKGARRFAAVSNFLLALLLAFFGFSIIVWVDSTAFFAAQALLVLLCMMLLPLLCLRRPSGVVVFGSLGAVALWALLHALGQGAWAESSLIVPPVIAAVVHHFCTRKRAGADDLEEMAVNHDSPSPSGPSPSSRRPYRSRPSRRR